MKTESTCPYCLLDGKALTAALDQAVEALGKIVLLVTRAQAVRAVKASELESLHLASSALEQAKKARE